MDENRGTEELLKKALAGRYAIEREIDRGGMATVYLARDLKHGRPVAIKVLREDVSPGSGPYRFLREIKVTAALVHPHILPLLDSDSQEGLHYYVMPFVRGESLKDRLAREKRLPVGEAVGITLEIADALAHAHRHDLIHRDIKPGNILLEEGHAYLADFGIVRPSGPTETEITREGRVVGTPHYQSPEQWTGDPRLDGRSDLYSLGCVLFEMLTGEPPFRGPSPEAVAGKHIHERPPPVRLLNSSVPEEVDGVVARTLAKEPSERYKTAEAFSEALQAALGTDPSFKVPGKRRARWRSGRRLSGALALLAIVLILVFGRDVIPWSGVGVSAEPDTTRFWVLAGSGGAGEEADLDVVERLSHALERWNEITIANPLPPGSVEGGGAASDASLSSLAESRDIGRIIRVSVGSAGSDYRVNAELLNVGAGGERLGNASVLVPRSLLGVDSILANLADRILFRDAIVGAGPPSPGTNVLASQHAYLDGLRRLEEGNLAGADSAFSRAVSDDSRHSDAHLMSALTRFWRGMDPPEWGASAQQALLGSGLSPRNRLQVEAILAQARGSYPEACEIWADLTESEPGYFGGWLGEAMCLEEDNLVLPDPGSPSGWSFRTSYHDSLRNYRMAFELFPSLLSSFRKGSFSELRSLFKTTANARRNGPGQGRGDPFRFFAVPAWQGDTLAFVPYPSDATGLQLTVEASALETAVHRQRDALHAVVRGWVSAFPGNPDANEALAISLSLLGDSQALDRIRRARAMTGAAGEKLRLAGVEAWLQLAFALPQDLNGIRRSGMLADSVLSANDAEEALDPLFLTALAALTGRAHRAAELVRLPGAGEALGASPPLRETGPPLLIYAALGGPPDSLDALEARVRNGIAEALPAEDQLMAGWMWLARPATLAFFRHRMDALQSMRGAGDWLLDLQAAFAAGDSASLRDGLEQVREGRKGLLSSSVTLDALLSEVELLVLMDQVQEAADMLDPALRALPQSVPMILTDPVWAASVVRAVALRSTIALRLDDPEGAALWYEAVKRLWSNADPFLQTRISEPDSLFE